MTSSEFVYVTYIHTSPEKLWSALTNEELIKKYWFGMQCECAWQAGSSWKLLFEDGRIADIGEITEIVPSKQLVLKWRNEWNPEMKAEGYTRCTFDLQNMTGAVKLTVTHSIEREQSKFIEAVSVGWPQVLSNLKSLLETGTVALVEHGGH
jgi:uncharacterized protein YndB with AHSA1/START domain